MTPSLARLAAASAMLAGILGLLYSVAFVAVAGNIAPQLGLGPSWILLLVGSLVAAFALAAVYVRVRDVEPSIAVLSLVLGTTGAVGAILHAGYEIGLALHPAAAASADLPSQVDPRGLATFGLTGLAFLGISWLMRRTAAFPSGLGALGYVSGVLLVVVYLGRLIVLAPTDPRVLLPAAVEGFIVNPLWYLWLGRTLTRAADSPATPG